MSGKQEKVRDAGRDQRVVHAERLGVVGDTGRDWRVVHVEGGKRSKAQVGLGELYMRKAEKGLKAQVETEDECNV